MAGKGKAGPNWPRIRARYERGGISLRDLAESERVPFPTIRDRSRREGWAASRQHVVTEVVSVTSQKVIERTAIKAADVLELATEFFLSGISKAKAALDLSDNPKDIKASIESGRLAVDGLKQALGITGDTLPAPDKGHDSTDDLSTKSDAELADLYHAEVRRPADTHG